MNIETLRGARKMLMGGPEQKGSPCLHCDLYKQMKRNGDFITRRDLLAAGLRPD